MNPTSGATFAFETPNANVYWFPHRVTDPNFGPILSNLVIEGIQHQILTLLGVSLGVAAVLGPWVGAVVAVLGLIGAFQPLVNPVRVVPVTPAVEVPGGQVQGVLSRYNGSVSALVFLDSLARVPL